MGIFSTSAAAVDSGLDMNAAVVPALESANYEAMAIQAVAESQANYNKIMMAIGESELAYFEENGHEVIYEAEGFAGFIESVKKFFQKLFDKVKEIFHKFFAWLDSLTKDNAEFAKKYEKETIARWAKLKDEFTFKGYKFTIPESIDYAGIETKTLDAVKSKIGDTGACPNLKSISDSASKESLEAFAKAVSDSDYEDVARGAIIAALGVSTSVTLSADEFRTELTKKFRNGENTKKDLEKKELGDIATYIAELKTYKGTKKKAEDAFKSYKKGIDESIKNCEDLEKDINKATNKSKDASEISLNSYKTTAASKLTQIWKTVKDEITTTNGSYLQALKDQAAQAKALVAAVITTGKIKNESAVDESAGLTGSAATMDFLAGVVLK